MEASKRNLEFRLPILLLVLMVVLLGPAVLERVSSAEDAGDAEEPPRQTELCLDCHDGYDAGLAVTPHRVVSESAEGKEPRVACTDCHLADSRHYEDDPEEFPMGRPDMGDPAAEAHICSTCHQNSHQQNMREQNVHFVNDINCSGCHKIHGSKEQGLLKSAQVELCMSCHPGTEGQFSQPYRHPVNDGIVKCSECHLTLDKTARELSLNGTNACMECHSEFRGPFPFEHQATVDYSVQEGGCLNCHDPHGSSQPRMLTQPYEPPHFQLCTQCHSVPPLHNLNMQHGDRWAGISCNECHSDIHGSYTNRAFLSQSLEGQGCLKSGCHSRTVSE